MTDAFFRAVTWGGSLFVLAPLALIHAALAWHRLRAASSFFLPLALAGATLMAYGAKLAVGRPRPEVAALIDMPADASFPSAHTLQITVFILAWFSRPGRLAKSPGHASFALGGMAVVLVAWSRLHLQVHYPSDILFALAAGTVWVLTLRRLSVWNPKP